MFFDRQRNFNRRFEIGRHHGLDAKDVECPSHERRAW
jgi:hypothetical protein